ncbi:MAG: PEGA domain-containing protein [Fimbriimonadaceae bacterium]|nr:PEGA domain-containing protein [Chitinophagales bacterium]
MLVPGPRTALTETAEVTAAIQLILNDTDKLLLTRVDNLVQTYKSTSAAFVNQYKNARKIVDPPATKRAFSVNVKDNVTAEAIANVTLTIQPGAIIKITSQKENAVLNNLAAGAYTLTIEKPGYITQTINFNIIANETTKLSILLVSAP